MMESVALTSISILAALLLGYHGIFARRFKLQPGLPHAAGPICLPDPVVSAPVSYQCRQEVDPSQHLNEGLSRVSEWLAREHDHMLAILNQLRVGVVIINKEGRIIFVSKAGEHLFDRDQGEVLGQPWQDVLALGNGTQTRLQELLNLPSLERRGLAVQWYSEANRRFWMEIEVSDDPHDPSNRIFYFYDVSEVADLRSRLKDAIQFEGLYGQSRVMQAVYREIRIVAPGDTTVLIEGETGTGKELVARAIHRVSARKEKPLLALNCAGLSESLLGSQLFGHRRGAFTGAVADQVGLFEAAHGGTLFLDEVGDIPLPIQSSLLRVLQEKEITRLGETRPRKVDVRIVAATHRDLNREVAQGNFRNDLFFRLCVARILLPPLRERLEDLPILVGAFLKQVCESSNQPEAELAAETLAILRTYNWPGNVRELKSVIESALLHSDGRVIQPFDLPQEFRGTAHEICRQKPLEEREQIQAALKRANGNRSEAARLLGLSRATLYRRLAQLDQPSGQ